jgi:predicted small secreted protein
LVSLTNFNKKILAYNLLIIVLFAFSGCATQGVSSVNHRVNVPQKVENEKIFDKPYNKVWDELLEKLSNSIYVIKNIDKESRTINLSFISINPENYVDCGETTRTYRQGNNIETYVYNSSASVRYRLAENNQHHPYLAYYYFIKRDNTLEVLSSIYINNSNIKDSTILLVDNIYKLKIEFSGQSYAKPYNSNPFMTEKLPNKTSTVFFKTNSPAIHIFDNVEKITCSSNGRLENEIFSLLNE